MAADIQKRRKNLNEQCSSTGLRTTTWSYCVFRTSRMPLSPRFFECAYLLKVTYTKRGWPAGVHKINRMGSLRIKGKHRYGKMTFEVAQQDALTNGGQSTNCVVYAIVNTLQSKVRRVIRNRLQKIRYCLNLQKSTRECCNQQKDALTFTPCHAENQTILPRSVFPLESILLSLIGFGHAQLVRNVVD